jgi:ferredoxin
MLKAIAEAVVAGKGIFSMKPLGGGNLIKDSKECFEFVLSNNDLHSIAIGMQSAEEVMNNVMVFEGKKIPENLSLQLKNKKRALLIDTWCTGCGSCSKKCAHKAITIEKGKAVVDPAKCVLCGYCSASCPDFCIKVV